VVDEAGQELGRLDQILETGANDIYVVKTPEKRTAAAGD
jgi:ribosomal 30S subunit maturation factor RimM